MEARRLKLRLCGTLGILVRAHLRGLLSLDQAELLMREYIRVAKPGGYVGMTVLLRFPDLRQFCGTRWLWYNALCEFSVLPG